MGMLYVFSMVFEVKKLISELKMTLMFMYCTLLYNFRNEFLGPKYNGIGVIDI